MTLAAESPTVTYIGDGSANAFSFPIPTYTQADLAVSVVNTGVDPQVTSDLVLGTDYTVSGLNAAGAPASAEAVVTLVNNSQAWLTAGNLSTGYDLVIQRIVAISQETSIRNQGDFYPEDFENSLDYLTMICQQLQDEINAIQAGSQVVQPSIILTDTADGHTYRMISTNGVFGLELVT